MSVPPIRIAALPAAIITRGSHQLNDRRAIRPPPAHADALSGSRPERMRHKAAGCTRDMEWAARALNHPVPRDQLPIPGRAQLRHPPLRREIHIMDAEALPISVGPFEIVHQAPQEIALDRKA